MNIASGTRLGRYEIRAKIGEGGMGEVYLAQDTKLDRKVALKILPAEVAADRSRMNRFVQEAKAASALNHPNIITIYEIDETDAGHFIATEFIDGETVRECLRKAPLNVSEALNIAAQVAAALAAAHQAGIIHRDIKPENVMVRQDGLVKVLDFGLAKLTAAGTSDPESATLIQSDTQPGMIMGTVAYMSPEQARGKAVDARTDVWSLGVLLYEMLSRRPPFRGETASDTLANILHREPDALNIGALPDDLAKIIDRMLAKKLEARYPAITDAASDLKRLQRRIEFDSEMQQTVLRSSAEEVFASTTASKRGRDTTADSASARTDEGFWVAVLPLKYRGSNPELKALAEELSEDIIAGLSRFSSLRVIARSSTLRFTTESADMRLVGNQLGARYVIDGSLRQASSLLRLVVQLVDASTGAHLWAETYDRPIDGEKIFALHDDLVPRIVSSVADWYGALTHSMSEAVRLKPIDQLSPYEAVLRGFGHYERVSSEDHAAVRSRLELAVEQSAANADVWAMLSMMYGEDYHFGFDEQPDTLKRALYAARRAVEAGPSNHFAYLALAQALYFSKEFNGFRSAAERAIALNPMDGSTMEFVGHLIAFSGDWEYGCELGERARALNPNHPVWYWALPFFNAYRNGDYVNARPFAIKFFMPGFYVAHVLLAAVHGQLGESEPAAKAVRDLLALIPDPKVIKTQLDKWYQPELVEKLVDGLRKAGLDFGEGDAPLISSSLTAASSETQADEGFWVAVLPFKSSSSDAAITALAEGLSEDIITGLSRFSYLRVIARSSTSRYASESGDVRAIGNELGARYVMEGSLRQAGAKVRLAVQLVDATNGAQLWAETYERTFSTESVFDLQDELVPPIVSTVADLHGVLPRSMGEAVRTKPIDQLTPYEALLRSFRYSEIVTPEVFADALAALELAVQKAPAFGDGWAMLASLYTQDYGQGFNFVSDSLSKAEAAGRKAVELAPSNHLAWFGLAGVHFFQKELQSLRHAIERAVALNPMDGHSLAHFGELLTFAGDFDRGLELSQRAKQLNPHHPGWYWYANFYQAFSQHDYRAALSFARKVNLPGHWAEPMLTAAASGLLDERESATKAVSDLLKVRPNVGSTVRRDMEKWWSAEVVGRLIDGLRKAGLEVADDEQSTTPSAVTERSTTAESSPSIAVLPFANLSNDPDNDYFCDGLAEELLNALSKIDELKVAARTSAFSFKGKNANVGEIASTLHVNTVLEGSVRKSNNRVRITTQLINAADGYHLWSERYDREMKDIFDVQDEITLAVVEALKVKLFGQEKGVVLKRHTTNLEAYEFYLRGIFYFSRFTPDGFQKAIESFNRAIAIDPRYSSAYAGLADAYTEMSFFSFSAPTEWMPKARDSVKKALELDDTLAEAHNSLAIIKMYGDWDYTGAEEEYKCAINLSPGNALIHNWYGWYLGLMGRFDESLRRLQRAQELDPLSETINSAIGIIFHWSRQPERAIEQFRKVLELSPDYHIANSFLAEAYEQKGDFASAVATIKSLPQAANDPLTLLTVGYVYAKSGEHDKALEVLNELERRSNQEYVPTLNFAQIYAGLGDTEQSLALLDQACNERSPWMIFLKVDPKFDPLRSDPRFQDILRRVGLTNN